MAHNSTVLAQFLKLMPRHEFESLAKRHHKGRRLRSMTRWNQFVAMSVAQLAGRCSLRDIVANLSAQKRKLYHLGVGAVARSSLARVNEEQRALRGAVRTAAGALPHVGPGHGFRFRNPLFSLDATTIDLCLSMFPWAKFRRAKGAVKLHLGRPRWLPAGLRACDGRQDGGHRGGAGAAPAGRQHRRGGPRLHGLRLDHSLISQGVFLVTRLKRRIKFKVLERRPANRAQGVTSDQTIVFTSARGRKRCYRDPDTGRLRLPDDQLRAVGEDRRRHLQVALAGGVVLQVDQAAPQ